MTSERWRKIEELYHAALAHDQGERSAFLADACRGDDGLQRKIESVLAQDGNGKIPDIAAAELFDDSSVAPSGRSLSAGDRLGPYEITALIGARRHG